MEDVGIYVLCYKDKAREKRMRERFHSLDISANFLVVDSNVPEVENYKGASNHKKAILGCTMNHIAMIREFYCNSDKKFGIFCENDVHINKSLKDLMGSVCENHRCLGLDVLLLGYLINFDPKTLPTAYGLLKTDGIYRYYGYHDEQWGTQAYMLNRKYAKYLLDELTIAAEKQGKNIAADWRITKDGKRALLYPPLFVEEHSRMSGDAGQDRYHASCNAFLYKTDRFTI